MATDDQYIQLLELIHSGSASDVAYLLESVGDFEPHFEQIDILHSAADRGVGVEIIRELLKNSSFQTQLNAFDDISFTPLMYAVRRGDLDVVKLLIEAGSDINIHDEQRAGNTALREAVDAKNPALVRFLLEFNADPTIPGWMNRTALDAAESQHKKAPDSASLKILRILNEAAKVRGRPPSEREK